MGGKVNLEVQLGIKIQSPLDRKISLSQNILIGQILQVLQIPWSMISMETPSISTKILRCNKNGAMFVSAFNFHFFMVKLNFLYKSTQTDIAYATHQVAHFSAKIQISHG